MTSAPATPRQFSWRLLFAILFARTVLDTATRAPYPFLPFIAADLNVSLESAALIIQVPHLFGLSAPLFGPLSDRYGRRAIMLIGLGVASLAAIALLFAVPLGLIVIAMTLGGLGLIMFVPAQQAFFGDRVPYAQRGRVMAFAEVAWSVSAIIGLPLVGVILQFAGWRWAFAAVGVLGLVSLVVLGAVLPGDKNAQHTIAMRWGGAVRDVLKQPMALGAIAASFLLLAANENINIIFGAWMKGSFALDAVQLGTVGAALGGAELAAELFAVAFLDRIGKWRLVAIMMLCGIGVFFLLPFMEINVWLATAGLVFVFFVFELAVVSILPVFSEIAPGARGTLLSLGSATFSIGRTVGAFTGPFLLTTIGFGGASIASGLAVVAAFGLWVIFVRERHDESKAVQP